MASVDADAVACDFAQFYHIIDWRRLPLRTAAVFAQGLPEDSRIMRRLAGVTVRTETALLAMICDRIGLIAWMLSDDGQKGENRPKLISDLILGGRQNEPRGFETAEDFFSAWNRLTGGEEHA